MELTPQLFEEIELSSCISVLHDYYQVSGIPTPTYEIQVLPGIFDNKTKATLKVGNTVFEGRGSNKLNAKKACAYEVVKTLTEQGTPFFTNYTSNFVGMIRILCSKLNWDINISHYSSSNGEFGCLLKINGNEFKSKNSYKSKKEATGDACQSAFFHYRDQVQNQQKKPAPQPIIPKEQIAIVEDEEPAQPVRNTVEILVSKHDQPGLVPGDSKAFLKRPLKNPSLLGQRKQLNQINFNLTGSDPLFRPQVSIFDQPNQHQPRATPLPIFPAKFDFATTSNKTIGSSFYTDLVHDLVQRNFNGAMRMNLRKCQDMVKVQLIIGFHDFRGQGKQESEAIEVACKQAYAVIECKEQSEKPKSKFVQLLDDFDDEIYRNKAELPNEADLPKLEPTVVELEEEPAEQVDSNAVNLYAPIEKNDEVPHVTKKIKVEPELIVPFKPIFETSVIPGLGKSECKINEPKVASSDCDLSTETEVVATESMLQTLILEEDEQSKKESSKENVKVEQLLENSLVKPAKELPTFVDYLECLGINPVYQTNQIDNRWTCKLIVNGKQFETFRYHQTEASAMEEVAQDAFKLLKCNH